MKVFGKNDLSEAAKWLKDGGVLAFPTETVYGLGCVYDDETAFKKLVEAKKRPAEKPFSLMLADVNDAFAFFKSNLRTRLLLDRFLPGEVTFLLPSADNLPKQCDFGTGTIGIRVPESEVATALIQEVGKPLLVTSCNVSGQKPALGAVDAINYFVDSPDVAVLPDDPELSGVPTTIVDLTEFGQIKPVREGRIPFKTLEDSFRKKIILAVGSDHAGFKAKEAVKEHLTSLGYEVKDFGTDSEESCDYPLVAFKAAKAVGAAKSDYGILICSSGEGIAIAANKVRGVRCGIGYNDDVSRLIREHNRCNMIAFGANFMSTEDIVRRTDIFLASHFLRGRHQRRVGEILDFESQ